MPSSSRTVGQVAQQLQSGILRNLSCVLDTVAAGIVLLIVLTPPARAGGPLEIAGSSYFDPSIKGVPLTWAQGTINYYTDRGNLSPLLPGASADAFVANAFSRWTSIPTAAVIAHRAGQLGEDVSGLNVNATGGILNRNRRVRRPVRE